MTLPISYMEAIIPEMELGISYLFSMVVMTELRYPDVSACCKVIKRESRNTNTCKYKDSSNALLASIKYLTNFWFNNPFERLQQWIPLSYFLIIYKRESRVKNRRETFPHTTSGRKLPGNLWSKHLRFLQK